MTSQRAAQCGIVAVLSVYRWRAVVPAHRAGAQREPGERRVRADARCRRELRLPSGIALKQQWLLHLRMALYAFADWLYR